MHKPAAAAPATVATQGSLLDVMMVSPVGVRLPPARSRRPESSLVVSLRHAAGETPSPPLSYASAFCRTGPDRRSFIDPVRMEETAPARRRTAGSMWRSGGGAEPSRAAVGGGGRAAAKEAGRACSASAAARD